MRRLSLVATLLRALVGTGGEANIVPLVSEAEQCLALAKTLQSVGGSADMTHDLAQALVFSCGHLQAAVALKSELQGAQLEAFNSWLSSVVGSPECARVAQVCTEGIQGAFGVCRHWVVGIFRSRVELGKLEDEAFLSRHASLNLSH